MVGLELRKNLKSDITLVFCSHVQSFARVKSSYDLRLFHQQVWNYKHKRCLFTLLGHLDYIRTTFFHKVTSVCKDVVLVRACIECLYLTVGVSLDHQFLR